MNRLRSSILFLSTLRFTLSSRQRPHLQKRLAAARKEIAAHTQGLVAREFDDIHSVERARQVGSLDAVIPLEQLRTYAIKQLEDG